MKEMLKNGDVRINIDHIFYYQSTSFRKVSYLIKNVHFKN